MILNDPVKLIQTEWLELRQRFSHIELDQFIVMPNHFHGIVIIKNVESVGAALGGGPRTGTRPAPTLGDMVGAFESITTNAYIRGVKNRIGRLSLENYGNGIIMIGLSVMKTN